MSNQEELLLLAAASVVILNSAVIIKKKDKPIKKKKRPNNQLLKRQYISHINLLAELKIKNEDWFNYLRIDEETYFKLLQTVKPLIEKENTETGKTTNCHERVVAALRFLAMGRSYEDLHALNDTIPKTCKAIYKSLANEYLKFPTTQEKWKKIASEFERRWNFPHCLGVLGGKHIEIVPPSDSNTVFCNHKERESMVLVAVVNANYEFTFCEFGINGLISDGEVLEHTVLYDKLMENRLNIPNPEQISNSNEKLPYVFVGDETFTLQRNLLKPFSQIQLSDEQRIFNYRLTRAYRIIENVFGILTARFKIFHTPIDLQPDNIDIVVITCCVLHNFLRRNCADTYSESELIKETNQGTFLNLEHGYDGYVTDDAELVRDMFLKYFNNEGAVEWQHEIINLS